MQSSSAESCDNSEIDLQSLVRSLWYRKWLILSVMLLSILAASLYAYTAKPVYEAKLFLIQPTANDIANINYGRTQESGLEPLKANTIYQVFLQALDSESLRQDFFHNVYLTSLPDKTREASQGELYLRFSKSLSVKLPTKDTGDRAVVVMENGNPDEALSWAQAYVDHASTMAKAEVYKDVSSESAVRARNLFQRIESLREVSRKLRQDSVTKLREALRVAEAIGLETPPIIMGSPAVELAGSMDGQVLYMRGSKALKAEIENLEQRESDDPFSTDLRKLQSNYSFYKELELNRPDISVYRQDGVALHPDSPIKPKRTLIVVLGLMLGLMVGVGVALVFYLLDKKRSPSRPLI
ncbi:LPS O-antigen chain length determinant protein WzzB [Pseudomonas chlororaphis]|uniref:LPS O-antigen chain length determinant protein WzzB n=1 Tax=Pseudomonas chlororaphis TaxID=587753 RepID=UPI000BBB4E2F|nr:Wzz/FepE/Etk N-terminal domain-containing protein [Pseudomonas chlororaphis]